MGSVFESPNARSAPAATPRRGTLPFSMVVVEGWGSSRASLWGALRIPAGYPGSDTQGTHKARAVVVAQ